MKTLAAFLLFVLLGAVAEAQQSSSGSRAAAETFVLAEKIVKGMPFSADAINESVQVLADGNRIVRSSTNKLYRNSEGRFRREMSGSSGGSFGHLFSMGPAITILDPIGGQRYLLDSHLRTARVGSLNGVATTTVSPAKPPMPPSPEGMRVVEKRVEVEVRVATPPGAAAPREKALTEARVYSDLMGSSSGGGFAYTIGSGFASGSKYETRTEELGVQTIEGVEATGTRTITTIPAGDIGNERPIEIVYERWYSNELQLVVMSKHGDPRFGEQTYRLTNIVRSEPDPSLFSLPSGYKILTEPAGTVRITSAQGGGQNMIYTRSQAPAAAATVKSTKP